MKKAHFSIDDVGASFRYIYNSEPSSIFDLKLYSQLKRWHEQYGLVSSLYCILRLGDFSITQISPEYQSEFRENADWLRFGFHSGNEFPFINDTEYEKSFEDINLFFEKMKMAQTNEIRLHSWRATDQQETFLFDRGIKVVLMPKDNTVFYDEEGTYIKNRIVHRRTDIWVEKMEHINEIEKELKKDYLTLFTHEWCFDIQKEKIEEIIKVLVENGYEFV